MSRRRDPKSAPALLACPYCRKARWPSLHRLNLHIGKAHEREPQVTPKAVLLLILDDPRKRAVLNVLAGDG